MRLAGDLNKKKPANGNLQELSIKRQKKIFSKTNCRNKYRYLIQIFKKPDDYLISVSD